MFGVFLEVLQQPEFREDKIVLAKTAENTAVSRRNDSFTEISFREGAKLAYGADNPYVRQTEYATIAAVTREDLLNWHKVYTHPNNMILGVVGDFDSAAIEMKLVAELHEVYGRAVPGRGTDRAFTLARAWAERRGVTSTLVIGGGLGEVLGRGPATR